jgi:hypothetical protein
MHLEMYLKMYLDMYLEMHQVDAEEIMWKRLCRRDYVEEIMWKRLCGREEVFNMSLVSVKMVENRIASVPSTTRTKQHQSSVA